MQIEQDADVELGGEVHEMIDLLGDAVHATDVGAILVERPIADRESNPLHASVD